MGMGRLATVGWHRKLQLSFTEEGNVHYSMIMLRRSSRNLGTRASYRKSLPSIDLH